MWLVVMQMNLKLLEGDGTGSKLREGRDVEGPDPLVGPEHSMAVRHVRCCFFHLRPGRTNLRDCAGNSQQLSRRVETA